MGAALFVPLLSQLIKLSINNTDNNELSKIHIKNIATAVAYLWKYRYL